MEVAVAVGVCATIPIVYKALRPRLKTKVNCWFCHEDSTVKYENRNSFTCPSCKQYNGFNSDGSYNRIIPEQTYSTPVRYCQPVKSNNLRNGRPDVILNGLRMSPKSENGLCSDCNRNQEIIMKKVNDFEPIDEDRWNEELEDYRYKLDRMYQLCARCTLAVHGKLEQDKQKYSYLMEVRSKLKRVIGSTINELIDNPKSGANRSRRFFFAGGNITEISHVLTLSLAIVLFLANIDFLQNDSGAELIYFPRTISKFLGIVFQHSFGTSMVLMFIHILACVQNRCRTTLPDLLIPVINIIVCLAFLFDEEYTEDCALIKCACFSFITILSAAVTLIPRKKLHRKRPNRILSSAFSVASTPTSQCSSMNETMLKSHLESPTAGRKSPFNHKLSPPKTGNSPVFRDVSNSSSPTMTKWRDRAQSPEIEEKENKTNSSRMEETMEWEEAQPIIQQSVSPKTKFRPSVFSQAASLRSFNQRESTPARVLAPSVASMSIARDSFRPLGSPSVFSRQNKSFHSAINHTPMSRSVFTAKSYLSPNNAANCFDRSDPSIRSGSVFTSISQQGTTNNSIIGGSRTIALLFFLVFIVSNLFVPMLRSVVSNNQNEQDSTRIATDDPNYQSYAFQPSTPSTSSWFGGLRSKLSQLGLFPDWMSQLGLKNESISTSTSNSTMTTPSQDEDLFEYDESTLVFRPVKLDENGGTQEGSTPDQDNWDFGATFLADLDSNHVWNDTIDRQHFGPLKDLITMGGGKSNSHDFKICSLVNPTWCDKCGDFIWGILREALKCENCNYTCHVRCKELVTLDCRSPGSSLGSSDEFDSLYPQLDGTLGTIPKGLVLPAMSSSTGSDKENGEKLMQSVENPLFNPKSMTLPKSFSPQELRGRKPSAPPESVHSTLRVVERYVKEDTPFEWTEQYKETDIEYKIQEYNKNANGMEITLNEDGETFGGHILIHMNLTRPINIVQGVCPPAIYDVVNNTIKSTVKTSTIRTITSFFLPRNTVKTINIDSKTTTRKMIVTLLRKFHVADNPRKFALYECEQNVENECTLFRKLTRISDDVCPLKVVLNWPSPTCGKTLVLQENDTGDILWDAFEIPELENFLRILGMEERQYIYQTRQKYDQYRYHIDAELRQRGMKIDEVAEQKARPNYNPFLDEEFTSRVRDEYGTSDSIVFSGTLKTGEEPEYVNLDYLKNQNMDQSTKL
ncbi:unnamed protein product [Caenorhabditis angaria]|uniref:Phorbol-ester/DAG-type domain-containing protein n=1 Tax=Caenorhabditis angaria TaxID=860376 RepID=A0A9P1IAG3_9PELO|nr:unnamed protein product [Caenorhabditis angaria]